MLEHVATKDGGYDSRAYSTILKVSKLRRRKERVGGYLQVAKIRIEIRLGWESSKWMRSPECKKAN